MTNHYSRMTDEILQNQKPVVEAHMPFLANYPTHLHSLMTAPSVCAHSDRDKEPLMEEDMGTSASFANFAAGLAADRIDLIDLGNLGMRKSRISVEGEDIRRPGGRCDPDTDSTMADPWVGNGSLGASTCRPA